MLGPLGAEPDQHRCDGLLAWAALGMPPFLALLAIF